MVSGDEAHQPGLGDQRGQQHQHRALDLDAGPGQALAIEGVVQPVACRRTGRLQHPLVRREIAQAGRGLEDRMPGACRHDDEILGQQFRGQPRFLHAFGPHHEVDLSRMQQRSEAVPQRDHRAHGHLGRVLQQPARGHRQQELRGGRHDPDADVTDEALAQVADFPDGVVHIEAHAARPVQEDDTRGRQPDAAPRPLEQRRATLLLQSPDAARERRLRAMEPLGGLAQMLKLGDGLEVAQVTEVHTKSPVDVLPNNY